MKELRENIKDAIYLTSGENQSDYVNKLTEKLMSLILDEVKEAVSEYGQERSKYVGKGYKDAYERMVKNLHKIFDNL